MFIAHTKMRPLNKYNKKFIQKFCCFGQKRNKSSNLVSSLLVVSEALRRSVGCYNALTGLKAVDFT